jgi:phage gpG-like protein
VRDFELHVEDAIQASIHEGTQLTRRKLIEHLSKPGTGKRYKNHTASSAGNPPARDTGLLANSIQARESKNSGSIGTNLDYAEILQTGSKNMEPREYLKSMWDEFGEKIEEAMIEEFNRVL